jgi:hypothetical protein
VLIGLPVDGDTLLDSFPPLFDLCSVSDLESQIPDLVHLSYSLSRADLDTMFYGSTSSRPTIISDVVEVSVVTDVPVIAEIEIPSDASDPDSSTEGK